jgi:cytochrome c oxidase cbb3-type subunit 3
MTRLALLIAAFALVTGCQRERRDLRSQPADRQFITGGREDRLQPGGAVPNQQVSSPAEGNAYAISQGERLFAQYNCSGCHFHGGGGIGPPLMEQTLHYGREPQNIFESIVKGRPNGMPAWGARIPEQQVWQLVAYVRSLSGGEPAAATPGRTDDIERKTKAQLK